MDSKFFKEFGKQKNKHRNQHLHKRGGKQTSKKWQNLNYELDKKIDLFQRDQDIENEQLEYWK